MTNFSDRYLWFRPESRNIWFRMAVPKEVQHRVGKKPITFSLGTSDRREAAILAGKKRAELFEEWGLIGSTPVSVPVSASVVPTLVQLEEAAVVLGYDLPKADAENGRVNLRHKPALHQAHVNFIHAELQRQARAAATSDVEPVLELADIVVEALGMDLTQESEGYAKLCELLAIARIAQLKEQHQHNLGDVEAETDSKLVRRVREREAANAKDGETIVELFELWAAEVLDKGDKRPDTVKQDRKVIQQFAAFVGAHRSLHAITPLEVSDYRETLRKLPPKWMSNRELRDLDMRAAAAKARDANMPKTAYTTINKHLSTISPLYTWLAAQPRWAGLRNPCDGLFYAKVKGKNARPPFTTAMLNKILTSPLFTGFLADGREHRPGVIHADDWRYWIPLIAMFTGARIGEIAQLRVGDVNQQCGVWFFLIRHEEEEGLTTKSGQSRFAAVHVLLERIGFLAFHARRFDAVGCDRNAPLFPELQPNGRGQMSGMPSRWWRDYLTAIGIKDGADGLGAHSFRHTIADRLREEAEIMDDKIAIILGHSVKTTTSGYGRLPQGTVTMFKSWMDAIRFDGVDFSHLLITSNSQP